MFFFYSTKSQEHSSRWFSSKDGLPASTIFSVNEDRLGYLWIGTTNGVSRFDGKSFTNYAYSEGLPDLNITGSLMDSQMRLWVVAAKGMAQFKANRFITYPLSDSMKIGYVFGIIESTKGNVWALTNVGVYEFQINHWQKISFYKNDAVRGCRNIIETANGTYINYGNFIVLKKNGTDVIISDSNKIGYYYNNLALMNNELFVSTIDGVYKIEKDKLIKLSGPLGRIKGLYSYFIDSKKNCWIGSQEKGLLLKRNADTAFETFYKHPFINLYSNFKEDKAGNIWVAGYYGLLKIAAAGYKIYDVPPAGGQGLLRNLFQPPGQTVFFNNGSTTLRAFNNGKFDAVALQFSNGSKLSNKEMVIDRCVFDDKGRSWYLLRGLELLLQDKNILYNQKKVIAHSGKEIYDVLYDKYRKKITIAVINQKYLCQLNDTGFNTMPIANNIVIEGRIYGIFQCSNDNIIFSSSKGYVYSIDKNYNCRLQLKPFTAGNIIDDFYEDLNRNLWINYKGRGLRCYEWNNDSLRFRETITKANGLPDDQINNVCFDNHNYLWASFSSGIAVLSEDSNSKTAAHHPAAFFYSDDLNMGDLNGNKMIKDEAGNIWLSANQKAICFFPDSISYGSNAPLVQIENIKINLLNTDWSTYTDSLDGIFSLPVDLKLPYNKNTLAIYFKAVAASGTSNVSYSYMLDGLDKEWSPASSSDFISFVNLPAGNYTFSVKAKLPNTNWSAPAVFSFEIKKAFWETWWFRLLVIVIASSLILFVFRFRMKQVKTKAELKNKLQDLESKALKAQMNPHFVFNAMNSIQSLIMNNRVDEAGSYISKFAKLMRQVLENADVNLVTIEKELYSLQLYIALEKLRMNVELNYSEIIDKDIDIAQERIPSLILQPFVENALWHGLSKKETERSLLIKMTANQNWIICEITDNGIGRKNAATNYSQLPEGHLSKATAITIQRLINFNRTATITPVVITDLEDESGIAAGTSVTIMIRREAAFSE
ncbi:MAG: histidine kinase [Ferruginibacter sp.]